MIIVFNISGNMTPVCRTCPVGTHYNISTDYCDSDIIENPLLANIRLPIVTKLFSKLDKEGMKGLLAFGVAAILVTVFFVYRKREDKEKRKKLRSEEE